MRVITVGEPRFGLNRPDRPELYHGLTENQWENRAYAVYHWLKVPEAYTPTPPYPVKAGNVLVMPVKLQVPMAGGNCLPSGDTSANSSAIP